MQEIKPNASAIEQSYTGISNELQGDRLRPIKTAILLRCMPVLAPKLPYHLNQMTDVAKKSKNQQPDLRNVG